jgi:hypothetical protein
MSPAEIPREGAAGWKSNRPRPFFTRRRLCDHSIREDDQGVRMAPRGGRALEAV